MKQASVYTARLKLISGQGERMMPDVNQRDLRENLNRDGLIFVRDAFDAEE